MYKYVWETPEEVTMIVAKNMINVRKRRKISQQELSKMSGVSYGSIKRFESTGKISFVSLTKIAMALDVTGDIKKIFAEVPYLSMEEVINEQKRW